MWPGWIPRGFVTVLAGRPGAAKSAIALDLAMRLAEGREWPDGAPAEGPGSTLLLEAEGCQAMWCDRAREWGAPPDAFRFLGDGFTAPMLGDPSTLPRVEAAVKKMGAGLVVVDSLRAALGERDENDSRTGALLSEWAAVARDLEVALVVVHHFRKGGPRKSADALVESLRGSSAISAVARSVIVVERTRAHGECPFNVTLVKSNLAGLAPALSCTWTEQGLAWTRRAAVAQLASEETAEWMVAQVQEGPRRQKELRELAETEGLSLRAFYVAKKDPRLVVLPGPDGLIEIMLREDAGEE